MTPTWRQVEFGTPAVDHFVPGSDRSPSVAGAACGGQGRVTLLTWTGRTVCLRCVAAVLGV